MFHVTMRTDYDGILRLIQDEGRTLRECTRCMPRAMVFFEGDVCPHCGGHGEEITEAYLEANYPHLRCDCCKNVYTDDEAVRTDDPWVVRCPECDYAMEV